ncbi:MAG: hypothetical protein E4G99_06450 [Anaerolineales bacterium]|nr:MAG: hypothetical protein E4G99_06450 [Anaerolineales bacterium]
MSHPQFETMLFERANLEGSDHLALEQHLQDCDACRRLASNWTQIEDRLHRMPMALPQAGFTQRFQARLAQKRHRRREWVMISLVLSAFALLLVVAVLFGAGLLTLVSPGIRYLLKSLTSLLLFGDVLQICADFIRLLIERFVATVSPGAWFMYSAIFSGLVAIWVASIYRLNFQTLKREVTQ